MAHLIGCDRDGIDNYFRDTWQVRHDGTLPTVADLAAHLVRTVDAPDAVVGPVTEELCALGRARLLPDASVVGALQSMRGRKLQLGVLSDASAEIAAAWPTSPLAALVDAAVFSCMTGSVKPDSRLYGQICHELEVVPNQTLYVGDGGGDELRGAVASGMTAVGVRRRGPGDALAFGDTDWSGAMLDTVEQVPASIGKLL